MASSEAKMTLKLFINKNSNKVLYAEAGKDFVDCLLHAFMMPLGVAMKDVFDGAFAGGLTTLFTSVAEDLSVDYLQAGSKTKACFLNPNAVKIFYRCSNANCYVSDVYGTVCPSCKTQMVFNGSAYAPALKSAIGRGEGYVKGEVTYMITDDLVVKPLLSTSLTMMLLSQLGIKDLSCIQETEVTLDSNQGNQLLKASLNSKTVLTDTFLPLKTNK